MNKLHWSTEYLQDCSISQQQQQQQQYMSNKIELEKQTGLIYPGKVAIVLILHKKNLLLN